MEEAVVGGVVGATIRVVLQNLATITMKEIKLVEEFGRDLEKLKSIMIMIQNILYDAEMQQVTNRAVKLWLKKLENLAFEADYVLDEFDYQHLRKETNNTPTKRKINSIFLASRFRDHRRKLGYKIREINNNLEIINQEASSFGLQMRLVDAHNRSDASVGSETDSFTVDPYFLGRDDDVSRIVDKLTTSSTECVFSILPIVGLGGLGKTTLARKVFTDEKIKTHFGKHIWVHISKSFDPVIVLKKMLTTLASEKVALVDSREALLRKLQESLRAKTYLLVLDDVWNQDRLKWEGFMNSLSGITSLKGNGIIVTTRNTEVASIVQTLPSYKLARLSNDDCWSMIKAKTFGEGYVPLGLEAIGRNIAKRCQGLPLAANVVGGMLHGKSKDEWLSIEHNWLSDIEGDENNISRILRLSFDYLPCPLLKKCFVYCSIFPKGAWIDKEELIELWMAEGFLQPDQRNDMETVGNKFFKLLVQNSLLQVVGMDFCDQTIKCSMHDLVHDLACFILGSSKARYIGLRRFGDEANPIPMESSCLRTLFFNCEVSNIMFSNFKCLHVLTLKADHVTELPSSIRKLRHLRFLNISYTNIRYLPDSIGKLCHLQTLRAEKCLRKLPRTLKYLVSLRHLYTPFNVDLPPDIGKLTSLQSLQHFKLGNEKGQRIGELANLQNLKGKLEIHNLEKVNDRVEAKKANLSQKPNLSELKLKWNGYREGETNDENVLEGLQPHPNLKILEILGFNGTSFPSWTLQMAVRDNIGGCWIGLNNLMQIILSDCKECEEVPMLGHLPNLKSLVLSYLNNVRSIGCSFYGSHSSSSSSQVCKETIIVFPTLERLSLLHLPNLAHWEEVEIPSACETQAPSEVKVFPCLEFLEINHCKQLMSAPSDFQSLKELNICYVDPCFPLENACRIRLTLLTKLIIERIDGLVSLPSWLFYSTQNLCLLDIRNCPNLRYLPDGLHTLSSLEELFIARCLCLESIPYPSSGQSRGFKSLRVLSISDCDKLKNLPCEMVESCAASLEKVSLLRLSSVLNLPIVIEALAKLPNLRKLKIVAVPKLASRSAKETSSFHAMQELTINSTLDSSDYVAFEETLDCILRGSLQSLCRLELAGVEEWDSLPNQIQHLTALSRLELNNFGIETLPEWFGNLTLLKELSLSWCRKLRHFPSAESMRHLASLKRIFVVGCQLFLPQACIEQQSDVDSELAKISHVPCIYVDGHQIMIPGVAAYMTLSKSILDSHEVVEHALLLESFSSERLTSVNNLPSLMECLQKSPYLRALKIEGVPIMASSCIETGSFHSLGELTINAGLDSSQESTVAVNVTVDAFCHSHVELDFTGMKSSESLSGPVQHLTASSSLVLSGFEIKDLSEWFGNLTSLQRLNLRY